MAFDADGNEIDEDAAGLRKQLAKLGGQLKTATDELATYQSKEFLAEKKFDLVEASDLQGVPADEREQRAQELQTQRHGQQEKLLRSALKDRGMDEEAIEEMVAGTLGEVPPPAGQQEAEQFGRARELAGSQSQPNPIVDPRQLHTEDALLHAFSKSAGKK